MSTLMRFLFESLFEHVRYQPTRSIVQRQYTAILRHLTYYHSGVCQRKDGVELANSAHLKGRSCSNFNYGCILAVEVAPDPPEIKKTVVFVLE